MLVEVIDDHLETHVGPHLRLGRQLPAIEERQVLEAIAGRAEHRLEQEVKEQVIAANVDQDRDVGVQLGQIRETLLGTYPDIRSALEA